MKVRRKKVIPRNRKSRLTVNPNLKNKRALYNRMKLMIPKSKRMTMMSLRNKNRVTKTVVLARKGK